MLVQCVRQNLVCAILDTIEETLSKNKQLYTNWQPTVQTRSRPEQVSLLFSALGNSEFSAPNDRITVCTISLVGIVFHKSLIRRPCQTIQTNASLKLTSSTGKVFKLSLGLSFMYVKQRLRPLLCLELLGDQTAFES